MTRRLEALTKPQIVTLAAFLLGGELTFVDREDIALKAQDLAPRRFGWRKHPDWVDLGSVACALRDAKKTRNGALLISNGGTGWMLTPAGLDTLAGLRHELGAACPDLDQQWRLMEAKQNSERERLRSTSAYRLFSSGEMDGMTVDHYREFAKVNEYFGKRTTSRRLAYVTNVAHGDQLLESLWTYLLTRFGGNPDDRDHQDQRHVSRSA